MYYLTCSKQVIFSFRCGSQHLPTSSERLNQTKLGRELVSEPQLCGCLLCANDGRDRSSILAYFTHTNLCVLHTNAEGLLVTQCIIFHLLKYTPNCQLKILASAVKQAISFQSNGTIKTSAKGHLEHNGTTSPIVTGI